MAESNIIVRMSKSTGIYNKSNKYEILINNESKAELDYVNNRQIFIAESGKNIIQIKNENTTIVKEINIKYAQDITITINASVTYKLGLGIIIGIAITGLIVQLIIAKKVILPLIFIPFISLLFVKKENFPNSFEITSSK
ncbi:hypothetical protein [Flavobacterium psychrolimnae]|uniref:Uncharacterized protein n=1 Tax=Flavobacterium psychrolimnae TaxID=249351 RepID=A0A366AZP9_9FLAO|nr:hypothetical protein [Flavobacterium psychrolimnae]RBN49364.1 hypothetical protein DR980_14010 [Flavobacterium psychrolimnae]